MTSEGLGEMFKGDSADMCAGKFPLVYMGGRAEGLTCAEPVWFGLGWEFDNKRVRYWWMLKVSYECHHKKSMNFDIQNPNNLLPMLDSTL